MLFVFFFKQKTAYEMRISDWSSDVCSSDLRCFLLAKQPQHLVIVSGNLVVEIEEAKTVIHLAADVKGGVWRHPSICKSSRSECARDPPARSEEHTSELQSLMRISYAVFCLKKKTKQITIKHTQLYLIQKH